MKDLAHFLVCILTLSVSSLFLCADDSKILTLKGKSGPGNGKTIVLVSGDEEYRTEESMPMLAKILAESMALLVRFFLHGIKLANILIPTISRVWLVGITSNPRISC